MTAQSRIRHANGTTLVAAPWDVPPPAVAAAPAAAVAAEPAPAPAPRPQAEILMGVMRSLGGAWADLNAIAAVSGVSRDRCYLVMAKLVEAGLVEKRKGREAGQLMAVVSYRLAEAGAPVPDGSAPDRPLERAVGDRAAVLAALRAWPGRWLYLDQIADLTGIPGGRASNLLRVLIAAGAVETCRMRREGRSHINSAWRAVGLEPPKSGGDAGASTVAQDACSPGDGATSPARADRAGAFPGGRKKAPQHMTAEDVARLTGHRRAVLDIAAEVARVAGVTVADITGPSARRAPALARQLVAYIADREGHPLADVALALNRDRSTIYDAIRREMRARGEADQ